MSAIHAILEQSTETTAQMLRAVADEQGWRFRDEQSDADRLVFTKGVTPFSLGTRITVALEELSSSATRMSFTTKETLSITNVGRGRRAVGRILMRLSTRPG